jgi:penicillin-binding protein 1A
MWAPQTPTPPKRKTAKMSKQEQKTTKLPKGIKSNKKRPLWFRILKWSLLSGLVLTALGAATIAFVFWYYSRDLPEISTIKSFKAKQVVIIEDATGERVGEIFADNSRRSVVPYEQVPQIVIDSFVAAEDAKFWSHAGIDYRGMVRAFFANLGSGEAKQGASTITQQVVKTFFLTPKKTFKRKIQEIILARRLEKNLTKKEILGLYMNQIYFGHNRYGVQEAARFYFGKDVQDVTIGEAALLAGLPQSPENISPRKNATRAKERQTYVLNRLAETGKISREDAKLWIDTPIAVANDPFPKLGSAPEWVDLVRAELVELKGAGAIDTLGATVRTTLDVKLQAAAQDALEKGLRAVDARQKIGRPKRKLKPEQVSTELAKLAKRLPAKGLEPKTTYEAIVTAVPDNGELEVDLGGRKAVVLLGVPSDERFNPPDQAGVRKAPAQRFAVNDVIDVAVAPDDGKKAKSNLPRVGLAPGPEGAVVVIEVKTRKVKALVGGYSSKVAGFNRATMAKRQPGSSFKPFVFAAAIESGKYTAAKTVADAPDVFELWRPQNYGRSFEGDVRLRYALARSINTVAIRVAHDVGVARIAELAEKMGIHSTLPRELSLSLGSGEVTPLDMTNAIATFAAGGKVAAPRFVDSIDGQDTPPVTTEQVLAPEVAYVVTDMMQSVVQEGTGQLAKKVGVPIAGKTGTSNDARDTWFIGMTPDYVIGVWVGNDDNTALGGKETGGTTAVPIFVDVAKAMGLKPKPFVRPAKVVEAKIDKTTGLRSPVGAPKGTFYTEVFVEGTAPTEVAPMPGDVTSDNVVTGEYED